MIITVNVLTAELTLKDGQTITLEDTVKDDIASRVMHELTASRNLVYRGITNENKTYWRYRSTSATYMR